MRVFNRNLGRTNKRLWLVASVCVFIALGLVDLAGGMGKESESLWGLIAQLPKLDVAKVFFEIYAIAFVSFLLSLPAALGGWLIQAIVICIWPSASGKPDIVMPPGFNG